MSDKTEEPTPKKLAKAREKGDVAVSAALSQGGAFLVAVMMVPAAVLALASETTAALRAAVADPAAASTEAALRTTVTIVTPLLLAASATAALLTLVQSGGLFAPQRTLPDFTKLNPWAGLRSLLSGQRVWTVTRALLSAVAVGILAWRAMGQHLADLANAVGNTDGAMALGQRSARDIAKEAALLGLGFALVDWLVTRLSHRNKLKMTKSEVKREHRESEGDPQLKAARHRAHHEMLAAAQINAVRDATVVIVNPEHLATALRYLEGEDEAPTVVAAGDGDLALRIQEAARAYGVPVIRDVPVARALRELQVGDTIPEALYEAVAEILREVWAQEEAAATDVKTGSSPPKSSAR